MIYLFSQSDDEHGAAVAAELGGMGVPFRRLEARDFSTGHVYCIRPDAAPFGAGSMFSSLRAAIAPEPEACPAPNAIWWRRPARTEDAMAFSFPTTAEIAAAEAWHALRLSAAAMPARLFPLGHPAAMDQSANKLHQLSLAREIGFKVPPTVIGNDPAALAGFLRGQDRVVVKPLHAAGGYEPPERIKPTTLLWCRGFAAADLLAKIPPDRATQLLIQQAVIKRADWRLTVLPHTTIACEIDTRGLGPDEPDWRKKTMELPHRIFDLDPAMEKSLRAFLAALGLPAGYFDFAIEEDGTPWFLEMNTNAQWLWIERLTGHPIAREVARCLAGRV